MTKGELCYKIGNSFELDNFNSKLSSVNPSFELSISPSKISKAFCYHPCGLTHYLYRSHAKERLANCLELLKNGVLVNNGIARKT